MLCIDDQYFINYLKNSEHITIDLINEVREAYFLKCKQTSLKLKLLGMLPRTFYTIQKIDEIYESLEIYQTIIGYWLLRKIQEELPNFNCNLPEEEPESVSYSIIRKLERTVLVGKTKVLDVISVKDDIVVIKKSGRVVKSSKLGLKNIEGLYLQEKDCRIVNMVLNERNESQRVKCERGSLSEYTKPKGIKVYCERCIADNYDIPEIKDLWVVNPQAEIGLYNILEDGTFKENKDFDSIENNKKKRKQEQLRLNKSIYRK